jgi:hypothetical protein
VTGIFTQTIPVLISEIETRPTTSKKSWFLTPSPKIFSGVGDSAKKYKKPGAEYLKLGPFNTFWSRNKMDK